MILEEYLVAEAQLPQISALLKRDLSAFKEKMRKSFTA